MLGVFIADVEVLGHIFYNLHYSWLLVAAPSSPPLGVKVTLIEDDTALVSWKQPDEPNTVVTRYTILYASRKAWIGGEWQVLQREGNFVDQTKT